MMIIILSAVIYLAIGAIVLAYHWRHPENPELDELQAMAARMEHLGGKQPLSHKIGDVIGTVLGFLVVLPFWPITLMKRKQR